MDSQRRCLEDAAVRLRRKQKPSEPEVAAFEPFLDTVAVIRVGDDYKAKKPFEVKHPILLKDDPLTRLIIDDAHRGRVVHMKTEAVSSELRNQYGSCRQEPCSSQESTGAPTVGGRTQGASQ